MSNINETPIGEIVQVDLGKVMESYDALSPRMKQLYDLCPINASPMEFNEMAEKYGESAAYWMIYNLIDKNFPGWNGGIEKLKRAK